MSYSTITRCAHDQDLLDRIMAAANKEAYANADLGNTTFGRQIKAGTAPILATFAYPVAVDYETEYAYAVGQGIEEPGYDPGVISDANIASAIQVHWPMDL